MTPASAREMHWRVHGLELAGLSWGEESGIPVLCLHGWLDNAASFAVLGPLLKGCFVVAPDLTGHGRSQWRYTDATYQIRDDTPSAILCRQGYGVYKRVIKLLSHCLLLLIIACNAVVSAAQDSDTAPAAHDTLQMLQGLDDYPHAERVALSEKEVADHEVGLGAIKKVRGIWTFRDSERLSGTLIRYTWQIVDGFSSREVMQELVDRLQATETAVLLFTCEGRACGKSAQWANRVFNQRILYGREDLQAYSVYRVGEAGRDRLAVYSAARTADRQYLHVDLLLGIAAD